MISGLSSIFARGNIQGSYEVYGYKNWLYCLVNRGGKKILLRMFDVDGTLRPEKLRTNAYAPIPVGKDTAFLGNILGIEKLAKLDGTFDLSRVEWE
ncbi:hypothetical protein BWQ96_03483 [Gracilariopsis chorda]|uniref:Uncharacterized protein n=1 Tax=Gracilariopsis chorda TaxID=448386 RepID=A0A2V3IXC6_9FLOR|nr:hypothetical protein BWQ96_03483 [Gracilariopsis chorda]|eukprot:PXF46792.1 hypothetical protein BWQ96_03483 [Gracilariopsis chorda]